MKQFVLLITLTWFTVAQGQSIVEIPADSRVTIGYPDSEDAALALKNKSSQGIDVATVNKVSGVQLSGFGLGPFGKATVAVPPLALLELHNTSDNAVRVSYEITEAEKEVADKAERYIGFTLRNETLTINTTDYSRGNESKFEPTIELWSTIKGWARDKI